MVTEKTYQCLSCGFWYNTKDWAKKCQQWCEKYHSCNVEITQYAIRKT